MKWQTCTCALAAVVLLMSPACGQSGTPGGAENSRDRAATERAGHQTIGTAPDPDASREPRIRPDGPGERADRPTGTSGTALKPTEEAMGLGPDAAITMRVQAKYAEDDVVKGRHIDVDTANGVVTLKGSVDSAAEKQAAERIASQIDGVRRVDNRLTVAAR